MPLLELRDVVKAYGGLRPFRLRALAVDAGEVVRIDGVDQQAAAVLTDLVTGAVLPDSGSITVAGRSTADLDSPEGWLRFLDRFGIVNDRVVLLDGITVAANLAVPLTLDLDPMDAAIRRKVESLAGEVGLEPAALDTAMGGAPALSRWLVRLGRAVALDPDVVIIEHPTANLETAGEVSSLADALRRVASRGTLAMLIASSDRRFAGSVADRSLTWRPSNGELVGARGWRRLLS
jgi:ABC-type transporter Mla maintaining outer membrane lipid asymmetry ATPase subunit MlaF